MAVLKRKKMYESQRDNIANQQFNMDQQSFAIESLRDTALIMHTMKATVKTMKKEYKAVKIDKIEDLQDDLQDMMEDMEEVQELMGRSYLPDDLDEGDLDAELAGLDDFDFEDDELEDSVPDYLQASEMPSAPSGEMVGEEEAVPEAAAI